MNHIEDKTGLSVGWPLTIEDLDVTMKVTTYRLPYEISRDGLNRILKNLQYREIAYGYYEEKKESWFKIVTCATLQVGEKSYSFELVENG